MQRQQLEDAIVAIVREFDGTEVSVAKVVRRIGKELRAAMRPAEDPRQQSLAFEEDSHAGA
jgi:hypothetical protein